MKTNFSKGFVCRGLLFPLLLLMILSLASCARSINFNSSAVVPAAEGKIKLKKDRNNNYAIQVRVNNLADPGKLHPPRSTYVVWMESADNGLKNLGQLRISGGAFGSKLRASLLTVTSFAPRKFFITAQDDGKAQYPANERVLETDVVER